MSSPNTISFIRDKPVFALNDTLPYNKPLLRSKELQFRLSGSLSAVTPGRICNFQLKVAPPVGLELEMDIHEETGSCAVLPSPLEI
jgi:hypothetical protein